jgi:hypothetical protein
VHHHGSDTPTSPRAVLHHTDANLCTKYFAHDCTQRKLLYFLNRHSVKLSISAISDFQSYFSLLQII